MQGYWVRFGSDGMHDAYSGAHFAGAEWVEGVDSATLDTCRRVDGAWVLRDPEPVAEPTPEDIARQRAEAHQTALEERERQIDAAILSSGAYRRFLRGEMTLTAYREAASEIAASIPMPLEATP